MAEASVSELWQAALLRLQSQVTRPNFDTWLKDTIGLRLAPSGPEGAGHTLVVAARSDFATEWLSSKLRPAITRILTSLADHVTDVSFEVIGAAAAEAPGAEAAALRVGPPAAAEEGGRAVASWPRPRLNPRFTFDSFVVGSCNRLAHGAAMAVASSPGTVYNPLVIAGAAGLGKTHLLHAIGHETVHAGLRVVQASAERFTNDYANASRDRCWDEFRWRYRSPDILIIDDVQFLQGKEHTLSELYHTMDELQGSSRQVVLAAHRCPTQIPGLSRLSSRLQGGLTAGIQPPNLQLRISILHAKAKSLCLKLDGDVLEFLAAHPYLTSASVREIEGCLLRVAAQARVNHQPITAEIAAQTLRDIAPDAPPPMPAPESILAAVCDHFHISRQLLTSKSRDAQTAFARQVAMYLLRQESQCTLVQIGRLLGDRDHSTVLYGYTKIARELSLLPTTLEHVQRLQRSLHTAAA